MQVIRAAPRHAAYFVTGPSFSCVAVIMASMKLSGEIFAFRHSPCAVSKCELDKPSEHGENSWEHFCDEQHEYEKRQRKFQATKLGLRLLCTLGIYGGY